MNPFANSFVTLLISCFAATAGAQVTTPAAAPTTTQPAVTLETLATLPCEITLDDLERIMTTPPKHQCTARIDGKELLVVNYAFGEPWAQLYFVLHNGKLQKIVDPPPFEYDRVPYQGATWERRKAVDPEKRLQAVLGAPDLADAQLVDTIRAKLPEHSRPSLNVLPAFVLASPLFAVAAPKMIQDYETNVKLAHRFDPFKAKLGMKSAAVDREFGEPLRVKGDGGPQTSRVYDSEQELDINPQHAFSPVHVVFENDAATRIFSNDFVDQKVNKRE